MKRTPAHRARRKRARDRRVVRDRERWRAAWFSKKSLEDSWTACWNANVRILFCEYMAEHLSWRALL